jgi:uncharacterized protein (DUF2237 family)
MKKNIYLESKYNPRLNVIGTDLKLCSINPITGYTRSGSCIYNSADVGTHLMCVILNDDFLKFTKSKGNDLITPNINFPGLKNGQKWCICVYRWIQAYNYNRNIAPRVIPESTSMLTLKYIPMDILEKYFK